MDTLIKNQEDIDLSATDIVKICDGNVDVVVYHNLPNYQSLSDLCSKFGAVALLFELKENFGHWTALIEYDDHFEFFDPYGMKPDEELNYAHYDNTPYLSQLIEKSTKPVRWSTNKLQVFKDEINTCGRWVATRIKMRQLDNNSFGKLFKGHNHYNGDFWVSAITYLYTFNKPQK